MDKKYLWLVQPLRQRYSSGIGNASQTGLPTADVFTTRDGLIQITVISQNQVKKLFKALGADDSLEQPEFKTEAARVEHSDHVREFMADIFKTNTTHQWTTKLREARVPIEKI